MSGSKARVISARPLTAEDWAPFGWLPVADTDPRDREFTYEFTLGDPHVNVIAHSSDEVDRVGGRLVCERLYRHDTHTQTLLALDAVSVIVVAPAATTFGSRGDLDEVRAFVVRPLDGFALARGTWHWGPFPISHTPVHLWNVQGKRYAEDNRCADLGELLQTNFEIPVLEISE